VSLTQIEQALEASEQLLGQAHDYIKNQIRNSFIDKIPGVDVIAANLENWLAQSEGTIAGADATIKQQIAPLIQNALPNAVSTLIGLAQTVESDIGTLIGEIATVDDVTQTILSEIRKQSPHLATWLYENVMGQFGNVALGVLETIEHEQPEIINPILDELLAFKGLPPWLHGALEQARGRKAPFLAFVLPALVLAAILPALGAMTEPITEAVRQGAWSNLRTKEVDYPSLLTLRMREELTAKEWLDRMSHLGFNDDVAGYMLDAMRELLDPETATRAHIRGNLPASEWRAELARRGISPTRADLMLGATVPLLSEDALRQSFLRGMIDTKTHDAALSQYGYDTKQVERLRSLYFYIPGPQDLIHMGIRNVFVPEIVQRFALDQDKPKAFVDAAHQQGISDYWAGKYWEAHWIMPGREAFFEMFQRTLDEPLDPKADVITLSDGSKVHNIIGRDTLNLALRDIDTPPFYRDKLTQVAYRPLTRIDVRRLAAIGLLSHANVERAYLDLGYNQKHARQLADFTDANNKKARKDAAGSLVDNIRREVLRLYVSGKLSEDEVKSTLSDLLFTDAEIAVFIHESNLVREAQYATVLEAGIGKLYVDGIITDKDAIKRMTDANIPVDAQSILFAKWDLEIEFKGGSASIHKHRELTAAEVEQALADGLISSDDAKQHFIDMGFDDASATGKVALTLYKTARATKNAQIAAVRASYVNGTIEQLDASNRLDALLIPSGQRDGFLTTWGLERETRTERIPLATLRDMAKGGYITEEVLMVHLKRHRYTDEDAQLIVKFWMAQPAPKSLVPAQ
jgi:hypothetical protein